MANSIFNYDNTLPGVVTEIASQLSSDLNLSEIGSSDSVVVIGSAFDGPVLKPVLISSPSHANYLFGKTYDADSKREASLVTGVENAWNKGCRHLYAMRINGIEMSKDFQLCATNEYKLRIQSRYPSNYSKQVYIRYDNTDGAETFYIYKPAHRATIAEKMAGMVVSDQSVMTNEIRIDEDYAFTKNSRLSEVLDIVNNHVYNNVIKLDIVDLDGNVVTTDEKTADITLGYLFPGTYFMGRKDSKCDKQTKVDTNLVLEDDDVKPYPGFEGKYYKTLALNTDVTAEYPIYFEDVSTMRSFLSVDPVDINIDVENDYLEELKESNKAFPEDDVDYEEMNMTNFDIYKRLGCGYATTAVAERRVGKDADNNDIELVPKIKEADANDPNRIAPITDGAYSVLQDCKIRYHVLAHNICADTVINASAKLPKHTAFKTTVNDTVSLMNGLMIAESRVDSNDETAARKFGFRIYDYKTLPEVTTDNIYKASTAKIIGYSETVVSVTNAKPGDKYYCEADNSLYEANAKGKYVKVDAAKYAGLYFAGEKLLVASFNTSLVINEANITGYKYFMAEKDANIYVVSFEGTFAAGTRFAADIDQAMENEEDGLFVYNANCGVGTNIVSISYPYFDSTNMRDFVEALNDSVLGDYFTFSLTQTGGLYKDEYVVDADALAAEKAVKKAQAEAEDPSLIKKALEAGVVVVMEKDRTRGYDYSMHIPYTTSDSFARQLAQHAIYTELRTYPCMGIIGCNKITDVSKTNLAKKVAEIKTFNWNLYVKNNYGRNVLDSQNLPYPIGRALTITLFQEKINTISNQSAIVNGATAYAGFISSLDIGQSSTCQPIDVEPMYEFSRSQLQTLSDLGIVTLKDSFTQGYVVTDGVSMAPNNDVLKRLFNIRVMHYVEDLIRAACEGFIGKANSSANRNALNTAITTNLQSVMDTLIRSFEFNIVDDGTADQLSYIDINYSIVPMNEIRSINNYITVKNS